MNLSMGQDGQNSPQNPTNPALPVPGSVHGSAGVNVHTESPTVGMGGGASVEKSQEESLETAGKTSLPMGSNPVPPTLTGSMVPPVKSADILVRKSNHKGLIIVAVFVLLLGVLGGGGLYAYQSGWLEPLIAMVMKSDKQVSPTDDELTVEPTAVPTVLPSPTPTVVIPAGWLTMRSERCQAEISYPPTWTAMENCHTVVGGTEGDCLFSENYELEKGQFEPEMKKGMVVILGGCSAGLDSSTMTAEEASIAAMVADNFSEICSQANQELGGGLSCEKITEGRYEFTRTVPGQYIATVDNGKSYVFRVLPPPPTTFSLLRQILGTFRLVESGNVNSDVELSATPTMASEFDGL